MVEIQFNLNTALAIQSGKKLGKIVTRDGQAVRIICTDAKGYRPVVALITNGFSEHPVQYTVLGKNDVRENVNTNFDLVLYEEGGEA